MHRLPLLAALLAALALAVPASAQAPLNPVPPAATTGTPTNVGQTTATFTGTVNPEGVPTTYHFDYGTSTSYGLSTAEASAGTGTSDAQVSVPVSGLTTDTTYHVRIVATNAAGITRGDDVTLHTLAPPRAPSAGTGGARSVGATTATLTGTVYPHGQPTTYHFDYGTSKSYGVSTAETGAGASTSGVRVSAAIAGLKPHTKYHYRIVATNATGVARGNDHTFTTLRLPQAVSLAAAPNPSFWSGFTTLSGRVTGQGVGGTTVVVQRQDSPFSAGFRQVATQATKRDGSFLFSIGPLWDATQLRVVTKTSIAVASPTVTVRNRVLVGLRVQRLSGHRLRLSGTVNPGVPSARVSLQRQSPRGRWASIGHASVTALRGDRSRYSFVVRRTRGPRAYRVVVMPRDGAHVRGVSRVRVIR